MIPSVYDVGVRIVECARCGAPVRGPVEGGLAACRACGAEERIAPRPVTPPSPAPSPGAEVERLSRLKAQLANPVPGHAYDLDQPPLGWSTGDLGARDARERLRKAWTAAKGKAGAGRDALWFALWLADAERKADQREKARAVLETALDRLADPGHRQLVRCRLAAFALADGDVASAAGWLEGCDPAHDVLEVDSAWREISAKVRTAQGDFAGVLAVTGPHAENVPVHAAFQGSLGLHRLHALESLGHLEEARAELRVTAHRDAVLADLAREALAPGLVEEGRRAELDALAAKRDEIPTGLASLRAPLLRVPALALAGLVAVTIPRCFFDADPFLGAHGYVLCPHRCEGCEGPLRVNTHWSHHDGEHSTNGPDYYCRTASNRVGTMSDKEMDDTHGQLGRYELSFAPGAATFLTFLVLGLLAAPVMALRGHARAVLERDALEQEMAALAAKLPGVAEVPARCAAGAQLSGALMAVGGSALVALLVILIELAVRSR